jgi:hypothetical protein
MMIMAGFGLSLIGWVWSVWNGFGVGIICGLLNFFFPPLPQLIFSLYEKRLRAPTLLMFLGAALSVYSAWQDIRSYLNEHQLQPGGVMVQALPVGDDAQTSHTATDQPIINSNVRSLS